MLCSVDYQWTTGAAEPGVQYLLVVQRGDGKRAMGSVRVSAPHGTIQIVLPGTRPDRGPFSAAVFARSGTESQRAAQISQFVNLRQ